MAGMPLLHPLFDEITSPSLGAALTELANGGIEERGAIFTRREVVDFVLDLAGYTTDQPLHRKRLLEPSVGVGDFLLRAIERLLSAYAQAGARKEDFPELLQAVRAVEIHRASLEAMRG